MTNLTLTPNTVVNSGGASYLVLDEIGQGSYGVVCKATPLHEPNEVVALKLVVGAGQLDSQLTEPEILSGIIHPNIIRLRDYFLFQGKLALVTEYVHGPDLARWVQSHGRLNPGEVRVLLSQMAQALAVAHAQGVSGVN